MKSSEKTNANFGLVNRFFNSIKLWFRNRKLFFIRSVAHSNNRTELSIISFLEKNKFKKNIELSSNNKIIYDYYFLSNYIFRTTILTNIYQNSNQLSLHLETINDGVYNQIASRFRVSTFNEFLFLITQTSRSPLFKI